MATRYDGGLLVWAMAAAVVIPAEHARAQTYERGIQQISIQPGARRAAYVLAGRLWIADLVAGRGRLVPTSGERVGSPVLASDGSAVVYLEWTDAFHSALIRHQPTSGGAASEVLRTPREVGDVIDAHFSRRRVVFAMVGEGLFEVPFEGGEPRRLTHGASDRSPRYSADGGRVAFVRTVGDAQDVHIVSVADGGVRRVQSSIAAGEMVDWSPDDRRLVFDSFDTGAMDLWTVPVDGGAARRLTDDVVQDHWVSWAGDGRVYVQRNRQVWSIEVASRVIRPVAIASTLPPVVTPPVLVRSARVLDLAGGSWTSPRDIAIENGAIAWIAPAGTREGPVGARIIDAAGLYATPGFIDMHVHYRPWMGPLMDRFGVSVMRDMGSDPGVDWILDERQFVRDGQVSGPAILAAGPVMNGSGTGRLGQVLTDRLDILRRTVHWLADAGMDHIKIGSENTAATLGTILEAARGRGLEVWGHIALVPVRRAVELGQHGIEHMRGLAWGVLPDDDLPVPVPRRLTGMRREAAAWWDVSHDQLRDLAHHLVARQVGWDATLTVMRTFATPAMPDAIRALLPPAILARWDRAASVGPQPGWAAEDSQAFDRAVRSQEVFLRAYYGAGGLLLTGSDVGPDFVVPGLAIHQEMARFVAMGVKPIDALRASTINAARALKIADRAGSIAAGATGDVVLLDQDPLADINHTRSIRWVVVRGRVVRGPEAQTGQRH